MSDQAAFLIDPQDSYHREPFSEQTQRWPGLQHDMNPVHDLRDIPPDDGVVLILLPGDLTDASFCIDLPVIDTASVNSFNPVEELPDHWQAFTWGSPKKTTASPVAVFLAKMAERASSKC